MRDIDCTPARCDYGDTAFTPIMTTNGVRLAKSRERESYGDGGVETTLGYGGWMDHSLFAVRVQIETYDGGAACKTLIDSERRKNTQASNDVRARQLVRF